MAHINYITSEETPSDEFPCQTKCLVDAGFGQEEKLILTVIQYPKIPKIVIDKRVLKFTQEDNYTTGHFRGGEKIFKTALFQRVLSIRKCCNIIFRKY